MIKPALALTLALLATSSAADTLIENVSGIQVGNDGKLHRFRALHIDDDGKVIGTIGSTELVKIRAQQRVDGGGRTLLPGLIDAHGHMMDLGTSVMIVQLTGTGSLADLQQRLRAYAAAHPNDTWIIGFGWNQELWPSKSFPTAADLDAVVPDRPVVLERIDGHAIVVNSAAMKAAGVTAATIDPTGGKIERDSHSNPTGLFVDTATGLVRGAIPPRTPAQADEAFAKAQEQLLAVGVTAAGSMSTSADDWDAFRRAGEAGRLEVRLMSYAQGQPLAAAPRPTPWLYGDHLRMVGVKLFADGALGSRGAFLKQPYADKPDTRGLQFHSDAELLGLADRAAGAGFQIATHAIGDAANAQIIGVYEQLQRKYPGDRRWRIEHLQIADPVDIPRLARAGIIASMQPTHQTSDRLMAEKRLGTNRLGGAYAWQSVLKSSARFAFGSDFPYNLSPLAFGSDFPVESPNPFPGLSAAISRQDMQGEPPGGWIPAERLTFEQALHAFTRGAAYAGFAEDKIGALEPGKWADFIIVDRDVAAADPQALARTRVLETWVAGKKVWDRSTSAGGERGK